MADFYNSVRVLLLAVFCCLSSIIALAQAPPNDDCSGAINIPDPRDYCSAVGEGTNANATPSALPLLSCGTYDRDVWYKFTAVENTCKISVTGKSFSMPSQTGGTMVRPIIGLYSGDCNNLTELACNASSSNSGIATINFNDLIPGETYYVRVVSLGLGTFKICVSNYDLLTDIDCPTAINICSKSPYSFDYFSGAGQVFGEFDDSPCLTFGESASIWFSFTAANDGMLEFTLTPNDSIDDLDFVLYKLPNGLGDCAEKEYVRCMASGEFFIPSPCMGPTGLMQGDTDIISPAGCFNGNDAFLSPLQLEPGAAYALGVNNFTDGQTGQSIIDGFSITWGGTALFQGVPEFPKDTSVLQGESVMLSVTNTGSATWISPLDTLTGTTVTITPEDDITYVIQAGDNECASTDSVTIRLIYRDIQIPNAFSPNGDGANETFRPVVSKGYSLTGIKIWSRWGEKIYDNQTPGQTEGWDGLVNGSPAPVDVYFYNIVAEDRDGKVILRSGELSLVR